MNMRILLGAAALAAMTLAGCGGSGGDSSESALTGAGFSSAGRANTYTTGEQQTPAVARNAAGNMVVVWDSVGQDGSLSGIYGQRFAGGSAVGAEFQVNTYTRNKQNQPAVSMDAAGNFVVVWRSSGQNRSAGLDGGVIMGQRFAADGTRQGAEFQIGDNMDYDSQADPAVAMNDSGQFVVAYSNRFLLSLAADLELNAYETRYIQARAYNADGSPVGDATLVYTNVSVQRAPVVGIDQSGNVTVAWLNDSAASAGNNVINPRGIYMQRYSAQMLPSGLPTQVSDSAGASDRPTMAMNAAGQFIIAWERAVDQAELDGIYARIYDASGTATGAQFQVSSAASGFFERASVGIDGSGNYAVVAQSQQGGGSSGVYLQRYAADGSAVGTL
ncbi:MAG TPA: hypothetical protein VHE37_13780, partial [Nevskiaceae bacterium]|nr:hypothetical protein [Nevskiaceae bacterium]